jgi:hypothetical protein
MPKRTRAEDPLTTTAPEDLADQGADDTESDSTDTGNSSAAAGVVDSARQAASQAKEAASHVIDQAKDQATSRADEQRQTAASGFQAVAHAFRSMGDDLRNREEGPVAEYAAEIGHAIGGQVERLATYLRQRDVRQLVSDAEDFARRSPAVFLGSAFVLGLAASRFLKSSRPAPDLFANMPDPNRALPPASRPMARTGSTQSSEGAASTPASSGTQPRRTPRVRSRSEELGTSGAGDKLDEDVDGMTGI